MIYVTQPFLPPLNEFIPYLQEIWKQTRLSNNGPFHQKLEKALCEYLGVPFISIFTNGTLPIMAALHALEISGEVITTPFSFVATSHALLLSGINPVFVDVDEKTGNLNHEKIEDAITPKTKAILAVHVFGNPCNTQAIQQIADKHGLKVIYDGAHAFGVEKDGKSILNAGHISTLSFHATKTYNTAEGGALVCSDEAIKKKADYYKNFGFSGETDVEMAGINGKMDEIRSSLGLLNLKYIDNAIEKRRQITLQYRKELENIHGLSLLDVMSDVKLNYSYFPVLINKDAYGMSRDALFNKLKDNNIFARRYFYPLISDFKPYRTLPSAKRENLPVAAKIADQVLCLPIYADLQKEEVSKITNIIRENMR